MAIDLDGDGIETLGLPTSANSFSPILFDHDANGVKTGTGWVKPDDAWLVLDRNGNGSIDSGRELFGVDTIVTAPTTVVINGVVTTATLTRNATSGFEALSQLDTNKDKVFNASDAQFANVRLWQDANQDGISQSTELKTLASQGITSINLTPTTTTQDLGNGNTVTGTATVTRTSGTATTVGSVNLGASAGNLNLADNPFYRQFPDTIALTAAAKDSPGMRGAGWVRDLQEAASLSNNPAAATLQTQMTALAAGTTRDAQMAQVDKLLAEWAKTTGRMTTRTGVQGILGYVQEIQETLVSSVNGQNTYRVTAKDPANYANAGMGVVPVARFNLTSAYYDKKVDSNGTPYDELKASGKEVFAKLAALEVFNGSRFLDFTQTVPASGGGGSAGTGSGGGGGSTAQLNGYKVAYEVTLAQEQIDSLNLAYDVLRESVYSSLALQTRLKPYFDKVGLILDANGVKFDTTALATMLDGKKTADQRNAMLDLLELNKYTQNSLQSVGFDGLGKLDTWVKALPAGSALRTELKSLDLLLASDGKTSGSERSDIYLGDTANNTFVAGGGDDVLDGGAGLDNLSGGDGDDNVRGGAGADSLDGGNGNDKLQGGADDDRVYGGAGNDALDGGAGNDQMSGDAGDDLLDGGAGNDLLMGGSGSDTYLFGKGDGQDSISNQADPYGGAIDSTAGKKDVLLFKAGVLASDVTLTRSGSNLLLKINGTTDQVTVSNYFIDDGINAQGYAVELIKFSDGTTWDIATIKSKVVQGTSGNDVLTGYAIADTLSGGAGNDTIYGADGNDSLNGGDGADNLNGDNGNDALTGGLGVDQLSGGAGSDTLDGGAGNDRLIGGFGSDTYLFGKGDGQDAITNQGDPYGGSVDTTVGRKDVLQFKAGVLVSDVKLTRSGNSLLIKINGTTDQVLVENYFVDDGVSPQGYAVDSLKFNDGTTWDIATVKSKVLQSSAGNDTITGYATADTLNGGAGNDFVYGAAGNDSIDGGDGDDNLDGGDGNDVVTGGLGADQLSGGAGTDVLNGGTGNDNLSGGTHNDTLDGGAGNDTLMGGFGSDTYLFGKGDGQDSISNQGDPYGGSIDTTVGKKDVLQFKAGVLVSDVTLTRSGTSLVVKINGTTDQVTINNYFVNEGVDPQGYAVELIKFSDGTTWDIATVKSKVQQGSPGNDLLNGLASADTLYGGAGNDTIYGAGGDDIIDGGDGTDNLNGDDGNDLLTGGLGTDQLWGGAGNDTLDGGAGNDQLQGGFASDTYLFGKGDGQDSISNQGDPYGGYIDTTVGKKDVLQFKAGVLVSDVTLIRSGNSLLVKINGTTDQVTINNYFNNDGIDPQGYAVDLIKFNDGTTWDIATVKSKVLLGTAGNDYLNGFASADTLNGGAGDDTINGADGNDSINGGDGTDNLYGEEGNDLLIGGLGADQLSGGGGSDTLDGGAGNDQLMGGFASDTYLFGKGDGQDSISNQGDPYGGYPDTTVGKKDVLQFKAGVLVSDVTLVRSGNSLLVKINGTTDQVTINNYFNNDGVDPQGYAVDSLKFSDGTTWDIATVKSKVLLGTAGNDYLTGFASADTLNGGAGNDTISGADGSDSLNGGDGVDYLSGDEGNDALVGGLGADQLLGGGGNDTLDGGAGDDQLMGGFASDTYLFGKGDGQDSISNQGDPYGGYIDTTVGKKDVLQFKAGVLVSDVALVRSGNSLVVKINGTTDQVTINNYFNNDGIDPQGYAVDLLKFNDGTTWDIATVKSKLLQGTAGNDALVGYASADTMDGGAGNDALEGGAGNDTYRFGRGYGVDTISDYDPTAGNKDVLSVGAGVTANQLWFRRTGYDLEVSIIGTTDKATVSNWYIDGVYHVEQFKTSDGKTLLDSQVDALVSAMAAFAPPAAGQTTLAADYQAALNPVISANWK